VTTTTSTPPPSSPGPTAPPTVIAGATSDAWDTVTPAERTAWDAIQNCEEGPGTAGWASSGPVYVGGLGFLWATWDQYNVYGFPTDAAEASPDQQIMVAQNVVDHLAGGVVPYAAPNCVGYHGW
jgi:hypothetical protein